MAYRARFRYRRFRYRTRRGKGMLAAGAAAALLLAGAASTHHHHHTRPAATHLAAAPVTATGGYRALGARMAASYGWTGQQWDALDWLWTRESGWSRFADNPKSDAYGIPQALPYTKMPRAAWPTWAGGQASAPAQIKWGLGYILGRYGSPENAWAHEESDGWY